MLFAISAASHQAEATGVRYLCDTQGFEAVTIEQMETGAGLPRRAVVTVASDDDAELVRWCNGVVLHIDQPEAGAGLFRSSRIARDAEDYEIMAEGMPEIGGLLMRSLGAIVQRENSPASEILVAR